MKPTTRFQKLKAWLLSLAMLMTFIPGFMLLARAAEITSVRLDNGDGSLVTTEQTHLFTMGASGEMVFTPVAEAKADVSITEKTQYVTYDKTAKVFEIKGTTLTGFNIAYKQGENPVKNPTNAGCYDVIVTREEDDDYNAFSKTITGGLVIKKKFVGIPFISLKMYNGALQTADVEDTDLYEVTKNDGGIDAGDYDVIFKLKDSDNYMWIILDSGETITLDFSIIAVPRNVWTTVPTIAGWTYGDNANEPSYAAKFGDVVVEYKKSSEEDLAYTTTVPTNAGSYKVRFTVPKTKNFGGLSEVKDLTIAKADPVYTEPTKKEGLVYNGSSQELINPGSTNDGEMRYAIGGAQATSAVPTGISAGEYKISCVIMGDENHNNIVIASGEDMVVTIAEATPLHNPEKPTTARVRRGQKLADATVTNGEFFAVDGTTVLEGTFAWVDDTKEITADSTEKMKFTPNDTNYAEVEFDVAVDSYTTGGGGGTTRYTVKFNTYGGSKVSNATVTRNAKATEPTKPEKEGYIFMGWFTDEALTEAYNFDTKVTKNITLYAKWEKVDDDEPENPNNTGSHNCPSAEFDDLDVNAWYHLDTDYVIENGIFKGVTEKEFAPNDKLTRAMLVTVLYRVEGEPATNRSIPFEDIDMGAYYANAVVWAQQNGIVKGVSETEFAPNDNITREQIAAIMHRYAQYRGYDVSVGENTNIFSYDDFDGISEYAIASMQYACGSGLMKGKTNTTLNPKDNATRAEIAAILHRFIEANK